MRFIVAVLSSLVLVACQSNSAPMPVPLVPQERSELTSDDVAVIYAALDGVIIQGYARYLEGAEKQGQTAPPAPIVLVERTIRVCDVTDYDPDWCVPRYFMSRLGYGSLVRLVRNRNRSGVQLRQPPGPKVRLAPLEESSPLGGAGLAATVRLKVPAFFALRSSVGNGSGLPRRRQRPCLCASLRFGD